MYSKENQDELPLTESLKDTIKRVVPYYENEIKPHLENNEKVLIVAHGNSLRALVMYLEHLTKEEIIGLNIPTGIPLVIEFDDNFNVVKKEFLGDQSLIAAKMNQVANQGKAH